MRSRFAEGFNDPTENSGSPLNVAGLPCRAFRVAGVTPCSTTQRLSKFAFRPWCNATRAIDTFGSQQALTTSCLNSVLYRRRGRFRIRVSIMSTYLLVDTIFLVVALKLQMGSPSAYHLQLVPRPDSMTPGHANLVAPASLGLVEGLVGTVQHRIDRGVAVVRHGNAG